MLEQCRWRSLFALAVLVACCLTALLAVECAEAKPSKRSFDSLSDHPKAWERAAYGALAADTATTCYGLSRGAVEINPLYGQECAQVAAINAGIGYLLHRLTKRHGAKWPFKVTFGFRASAATWNLHQMTSR